MFLSARNACVLQYVTSHHQTTQDVAADCNVECDVELQTTKAVPLPVTEMPVNTCDPGEFFRGLPTFSKDDILAIEKATRGQSDNQDWISQRKGRITGSVIHDVKTKVHKILCDSKQTLDCDNLVSKIVFGASDIGTMPAIKYGQVCEKLAIDAYIKKQVEMKHHDISVQACGLFCLENMYVAASPDGIITCSCCGTGVLEIKCPKSKEFSDLREDFPDYLVNEKGKLSLKKSHRYYSQVQSQMGCTNTKFCDFVVYSKKGIIIERIAFDHKAWTNLLDCAEYFFQYHVCPKILSNSIQKRHIIQVVDESNVTNSPQPNSNKFQMPNSNVHTVQTPLNASNITHQASSSQPRKRRRIKPKVESRPEFVCPTCELSCKYSDNFTSDSDNTVQCGTCLNWYHWECVGYEEDNEEDNVEWYCEVCLILGLQNTNMTDIPIELL